GWRNSAPPWMFPAHQCFKTGNITFIKPNNRLIDQMYFVALKRPAQIGFKLQLVTPNSTERRAERFYPIAAKTFGLMHRQIGVFHKIFSRYGSFRPGDQSD